MTSPATGKVVLVTGAGRRVGAAIARTLHAAGDRLVLHAHRSLADALTLADEFNASRPDSAHVLPADLTDPAAVATLGAAAIAAFDRLDALVNNASSFFPTAIGDIDLNAWADLIGSNLQAPLFLSQAVAPALRDAQGSIVNLIDIHAERPLKGYPLYSTAKAGLAGLTRALAIELAPEIRVNGVAPGPILWPADGAFDSDSRAAIIAATPLGREGCPDDIARTVRFLIHDASYVSGQILAVDGGRSLHL